MCPRRHCWWKNHTVIQPATPQVQEFFFSLFLIVGNNVNDKGGRGRIIIEWSVANALNMFSASFNWRSVQVAKRQRTWQDDGRDEGGNPRFEMVGRTNWNANWTGFPGDPWKQVQWESPLSNRGYWKWSEADGNRAEVLPMQPIR